MIVYGDKVNYAFNKSMYTNVDKVYEVVHLPRLYDMEQLERIIYELVRGSICQDNIEKCGLPLDREGGREALHFTSLLGLTEPFKKNGKMNYRLTEEGISVVSKDVGQFIESEIFRFTPFIFIYDYINNEPSEANRTRAAIIQHFNRLNPKIGDGDSGKKNIEVAISILSNYGYLNNDKGVISVSKKPIKSNVLRNSNNIIYLTIDDFKTFYDYLKTGTQTTEIGDILKDKSKFVGDLSKLFYKLKWMFINNNCEDLTIELNTEESSYIDLFITFLKIILSSNFSKNKFISKLDDNKYMIRTYFDISLKSDKIADHIDGSSKEETFHPSKGDADKVSSLGIRNNYYKSTIPFKVAVISFDDIEGIEIVSKLNSFNTIDIGLGSNMQVHYEVLSYTNLSKLISTFAYDCIIIVDPSSENEEIRTYFKDKTNELKEYLNKGGNVFFLAPIQQDFEDGKIENSKKGNDFFRDLLKKIHDVDNVPRLYHTGAQNTPHMFNKVNLTERGRKYLVSLGENLALDKPIYKEINTLGILTLPINIGPSSSIVGNYTPLLVPLDETNNTTEAVSLLLAKYYKGNIILSTFSKESFKIESDIVEIVMRVVWILCISSEKSYLKKFATFI